MQVNHLTSRLEWHLNSAARVAALALACAVFLGGFLARAAAAETLQDMLAAQIRMQGFACDKTINAVKDAKRSRPDHDVWVLQCSNATFRVSRAPDMAARVEPIR